MNPSTKQRRCRYRSMLSVTSGLLFFTASCGQSYDAPPQDICNDRAYDECARIAHQRCGLSGMASEEELQRCDAFVSCDNAAYDRCMAELAR